MSAQYPHIYQINSTVTDIDNTHLIGNITTQLPYRPNQGGAQYVILWSNTSTNPPTEEYAIELESALIIKK